MGNLTLCEHLTGGKFDSISCQHSEAFDHLFGEKSQMPGGLPGGGWAPLDLTDTLPEMKTLHIIAPIGMKPAINMPLYPKSLIGDPS